MNKAQKEKLKDIQELAIKRGIKCLSKVYERRGDRLEFECQRCPTKVTWKGIAFSFLSGKAGCPRCDKVKSHERWNDRLNLYQRKR